MFIKGMLPSKNRKKKKTEKRKQFNPCVQQSFEGTNSVIMFYTN